MISTLRIMKESHVTKVVRVSPIKTVVFTVKVTKDFQNGRPKLEVLARITLVQRGIVVKGEATNVVLQKR